MDCTTTKTRKVKIFWNLIILYGTPNFRFMTYIPIPGPSKEHNFAHHHATLCQRIWFRYGWVTCGDAQKNRFSSGRDVFSRWTKCSNMILLKITTNPKYVAKTICASSNYLLVKCFRTHNWTLYRWVGILTT